MNLERSIANLEKELNIVDPAVGTRNKTGLSSWRGRQIIPLDEWIKLRDTPYALEYFPDGFDQTLTCMPGGEIITQREQEDLRKWGSDYQKLMEYTNNPNYDRLNLFSLFFVRESYLRSNITVGPRGFGKTLKCFQGFTRRSVQYGLV